MKRIILVLLALGFYGMLYSQSKLSGIVYDIENNEVLPGASVYFPELSMGCQTDNNGFFSMEKLPSKSIKVEISYLGYKPLIQTIDLSSGDVSKDFHLQGVAMQTNEVVISGGTHSTQHDNPIKVEILKPEQLFNAGEMSFASNLSMIPGVETMSYGPAVTKPVIRGLSMTNILMLNNGVKLENFQFSENHPFLIDEFGADRIEIIKGPASLLYGSEAVGGVINLIPEKPAPIGHVTGDFSTAFYSNTRGLQSTLGLKGSSQKWSWGLRAGLRSHEDYIDGEGNAIPNTRFNEKSLKVRLTYRNRFGNYGLSYHYNRPQLGMSVGDVVPLISENSRANEFWYQDLTNHLVIMKNKLYAGNWKFDVNAAWQMNNRKLQTDDSKPAFEMVNMNLNTLSWDVKSHVPLAERSEFIVGIQGAQKTNRNGEAPNRVIPDADVFDISGLSYFSHSFPGRVSLQAGIRYDYRDLAVTNVQGEEYLANQYGNVSASTGATWQVKEAFLLRMNLATAFRTPNIAELTQDGVHGVRYEQGNPGLNSQRSYEADISAHFHNDWLLLDVAGFYHHINDYIYLAPTSDSINNYLVFKYKQDGAKLYGSEVSMDILPTQWLDFRATYAWMEAIRADGDYLPLIPQNKLRLDLRFQPGDIWKFKSLCLNFGSTYAFAKDDVSADEEPAEEYLLLHAGIKTRVSAGRQEMEFSLRLNNLLDQAYTDHLSNLKEMGYYNMGRNIVLSVKIPFGLARP